MRRGQRGRAAFLALVLSPACALPIPTHAAQPESPLSPAATPGASLDTLEQRALPCSACHGRQGRATRDGFYPRIAGKPAGYLYNQLLNFRDGRRHYPQMAYLVQRQRDEYLREIARYFAQQDLPYAPEPPTAADPARLARGESLVRQGDAGLGVPACQACHGERLTGVQPAVPGLVGLPYDYLVAQLGAWREHTRRAQAPDCMAGIAEQLSPEDLSAVAAWLSSRPLPDDTHPAPPATAPLPRVCGGVDASAFASAPAGEGAASAPGDGDAAVAATLQSGLRLSPGRSAAREEGMAP